MWKDAKGTLLEKNKQTNNRVRILYVAYYIQKEWVYTVYWYLLVSTQRNNRHL